MPIPDAAASQAGGQWLPEPTKNTRFLAVFEAKLLSSPFFSMAQKRSTLGLFDSGTFVCSGLLTNEQTRSQRLQRFIEAFTSWRCSRPTGHTATNLQSHKQGFLFIHLLLIHFVMRSQNTGPTGPSIFSRLSRRPKSEKNQKDILDSASPSQKKPLATIIRSPRDKKREKAESHQILMGSPRETSTFSPHTQLPVLPQGCDVEDRTEQRTSEEHVTFSIDEGAKFPTRPTEPASFIPIKLHDTRSEGSSSQLASDDALALRFQLTETTGIRGARPEAAKTLVRSPAKKNLTEIITPQKKSSSSGETQPIQIREQSSSGDELFTSGTLSPRRFPGMAELPTLDRSAKKRIAYGLGQKAEAKLDRIRKRLPAGAILDKQGNLSGRYKFTKYPVTSDTPAPHLEDAISEKLGKFLDFEAARQIDRPVPLNGILVASLARADFHRLNYEFKNTDGTVKDLPLPTKADADEYLAYHNYSEDYRKTANEVLRSRQIARTLLDFVSDEDATPEENSNTALALSSLLTQATPELLAFVVYGQESALKMFKSKTEGKHEPAPEVTIMDSRGETKPVVAKQFGATKFTISRVGADFLIAVDFPTYAEARRGHEGEVPLNKNSVLGIHASTEILVDGNAARNSILSVKLPTGIQAEYSGRLAITESDT
ncbi:hypothetical protein [Variovorax sp. DT-64]|uniref:hypothetical protein n=1 Tax=Variovorax sp. DT-64 TaxID=3396160 RepID=UPI003F1A623C